MNSWVRVDSAERYRYQGDPRFELRKDWAYRRGVFQRAWVLFYQGQRRHEVQQHSMVEQIAHEAENFIQGVKCVA